MKIDTHFNLGDKAWRIENIQKNRFDDCPDCDGGSVPTKGKPISCPRCCGKGLIARGTQPSWRIESQPMTVDQIRMEIGLEESKEEYMCRETGVGSGQIHRLRDMFKTPELAQAEADRRNLEESVTYVCVRCLPDYERCNYQVKNRDHRYCHIHGYASHVDKAQADVFLAKQAEKEKKDEDDL